MKSFRINLNTFMSASGVNVVYPVQAPYGITIQGYSGSASVAFPGQTQGFSEVLIVGAMYPTIAGATWAQNAEGTINPVFNPDVGQPTISSITGGAGPTDAAMGGGNVLLSTIIKTNAPAAANLPLSASGLNFQIPHGGCLAIHVDGDGVAGQDPINMELQLVVFYQ